MSTKHSTGVRRGRLRALLGGLASTTLMVGLASAQVPQQLGSEATASLQEESKILSAPPSDSRRVYVLDPGHFNATSTIYTVDGGSSSLLAMTDAGKLPHVMVASDGRFFAVANTVYSRIARGTRDDYVELIDSQTHKVLADIDIPEGRFLTGVLERLAAMSLDDKHLLFQQFSPSPGVGLVDLEKKAFVKMMEVPDCYHLFPVPQQQFFMHCRDGSLLQVSYDGEGNTRQKSTKVFHREDEYLLNNPFYSNASGRLVWPSYEGRIFQANLSAAGAEFLPPFEVFTEQEKADKWRPGGWQPIAYHKASNEIYLLADQREKWTHKLPSRFVFVVDGSTGKRLRRIDLGHEIDAIGVSQDASPLLYAVSATDKTLYIHDARSGAALGAVDELGRAPTLVVTPDR